MAVKVQWASVFWECYYMGKFQKLCLSTHLKCLSPHVAIGDKVGQRWFKVLFSLTFASIFWEIFQNAHLNLPTDSVRKKCTYWRRTLKVSVYTWVIWYKSTNVEVKLKKLNLKKLNKINISRIFIKTSGRPWNTQKMNKKHVLTSKKVDPYLIDNILSKFLD